MANRIALEWTVKLGLALGCEIAERAVFARKHYPYPGIPPKGYQISQYDLPSCINGKVLVHYYALSGKRDHTVDVALYETSNSIRRASGHATHSEVFARREHPRR